MRDTDRGRRSERFAAIWPGMTAADAAALAPELFANEAGSPFQNDWLEFLQLWGRLDPHAALEFTQANAASQAADWHRAIARGWAAQDPAAAAAWWLTEPTVDRDGIGSTIASLWANADWKAAAEWVRSHVTPAEQPGLANAIAFQLVQNQPDTGKALVEATLGRATPPTALETSLFYNFAREMPIDWLSQVKGLFPVPPILLERLAQEMPTPAQGIETPDPRAKEWFLWLVEPKTGLVLEDRWSLEILKPVDELFQHWVAGDPEDASRWLAGQPATPIRNKFAHTLIDSMMDEDPEGARQWLASLPPESRKAFYSLWTLTRANRIDPAMEAIMKSDGFNHLRDPHIILRELEEAETPQRDPTQ